MAIGTILATTFSLLAPFLKKGGEEFAKKAGGRIWEKLENRFKGNKEAEELNKLKDDPDNVDQQEEVKYLLGSALREDEAFKNELKGLLDELEEERKSRGGNTMTITGDGNIGIQGVQGSTINVNTDQQ